MKILAGKKEKKLGRLLKRVGEGYMEPYAHLRENYGWIRIESASGIEAFLSLSKGLITKLSVQGKIPEFWYKIKKKTLSEIDVDSLY